MKVLKFSAVFFFLIFLVGNAFASKQFAGIADGKLCLSVRAVGQKTTTQMTSKENIIYFYSAKVTVKSISHVEAGATGAAALSAYLYNESRGPGSGQDYNEGEGDVWLDIRIKLDENNNLIVTAGAERNDNADGSWLTTLFDEHFTTSISLDTEYTLSIEVAYPKVSFKCNEEVLSYNLAGTPYPANWGDRRIMSRIYADEGQSGYFSATFDDVCIDQEIPYDNFEDVILLDEQKWDVDFDFQWWFVQHRKKEDGSELNRACFGLFYNDYINITGDIIDTIALYDSEGNEISISEKHYWEYGENSFTGGYNCETSHWYYSEWGEVLDYYYGVDFTGPLQPETYHMLVTLKDTQEFVIDKAFGGIKELPIIPSDSIYFREDSGGNVTWTWDVPEGVSQDWSTSIRAFVKMYDASNVEIGDLTITVPTHLGRVFIPVNVFHSFEGRMDELGCDTIKLCVQLRTNDNCNRAYSNEITLEEAENPPVHCDINGDGKTGLEEAIHALQVVSGSR